MRVRGLQAPLMAVAAGFARPTGAESYRRIEAQVVPKDDCTYPLRNKHIETVQQRVCEAPMVVVVNAKTKGSDANGRTR